MSFGRSLSVLWSEPSLSCSCREEILRICFVTILLGIGGSFAATYIGQHFGWYREGQPAGFIGAILGAILILVLYRLIRRR